MFTGLIEDIGTIRGQRRSAQGMELSVATALPMDEIHLGDSIAVNGVCLTVTSFGGGQFSADVSPETLDRTGLGHLAVGSRINLERAMRLGDRLGGHLVSGHVDARATIVSRQAVGNSIVFEFALPPSVLRYIVKKGSVAIDGISLTVNDVNRSGFSVAVIPHTLERTILKEMGPGFEVNIETDMIGKYVERLLTVEKTEGESKGRIDIEFLAKNGFL